MLLFYSVHCAHCKMLLETIQRADAAGKIVKLISVEALRAAGKLIPPAVHSVPAMMLMPSKRWLYGKAVFDHLLMPGRGALVSSGGAGFGDDIAGAGGAGGAGPGGVGGARESPAAAAGGALTGEPASFGFGGGGLSEAFAPIDSLQSAVATDPGLDDRAYLWSSVSDVAAPAAGIGRVPAAGAGEIKAVPVGGAGTGVSGGPMMGSAGSETRSKKQLPSLEDIRRQRAEM
jgi:hypothetical protein